MIKVGEKLPSATLFEFIEVEGNGCSLGPNPFEVQKSTAGKKIALFALPAFVMGAWGRDQKTGGKVRMMADGSAEFSKAVGLTLDLSARGLGLRSNRYSMLVVDGVVKTLNVEGPGEFKVSDAETLLAQAKAA
jgi:peroxiredoxin